MRVGEGDAEAAAVALGVAVALTVGVGLSAGASAGPVQPTKTTADHERTTTAQTPLVLLIAGSYERERPGRISRCLLAPHAHALLTTKIAA